MSYVIVVSGALRSIKLGNLKPEFVVEMKRNRSDLFVGFFVTIFSLFLYFVIIPTQVTVSVEKKFSSLYFPKAAALVLIIISLVILLQSVLRLSGGTAALNHEFNKVGLLRVFLSFSLITASYFGFDFLGYFLVTALSMIGWMFLFRETNWKSVALVSLLTPLITYYFFTAVMGVSLPRGILLDILSELI